MGFCCWKNTVQKQNEDIICEIISKLKITQFSLGAFNFELNNAMKDQIICKKKDIEEDLAELFYEENPFINNYRNIHQRIFEELFYIFSMEVRRSEILLYLFPLLSKTKGKESGEFSDILKEYFGNYYSLDELHIFYLKLFEFYSFKITRIIQFQEEYNEIMKNLTLMNKYFFTFEKIEYKVTIFLKPFKNDRNETKNIYFDNFKEHLKSKALFSYSNIRDYILTPIIE